MEEFLCVGGGRVFGRLGFYPFHEIVDSHDYVVDLSGAGRQGSDVIHSPYV